MTVNIEAQRFKKLDSFSAAINARFKKVCQNCQFNESNISDYLYILNQNDSISYQRSKALLAASLLLGEKISQLCQIFECNI
uniref:Uncharacterized protein n=1 Tax=Romanomermis culicivorax TaxID=13658 RepID=A0A915IN45_ROMCU